MAPEVEPLEPSDAVALEDVVGPGLLAIADRPLPPDSSPLVLEPPEDIFVAAALQGIQHPGMPKAKLDFWSHQSGKRRCYIRCSGKHKECYRYRFVSDFSSVEECAGYLAACSELGRSTDRHFHVNRECQPTEEAIARFVAGGDLLV